MLSQWQANAELLTPGDVLPVWSVILVVQFLVLLALVIPAGGVLAAGIATSAVTAYVLFLPGLLDLLPGGGAVQAMGLCAGIVLLIWATARLRASGKDRHERTAIYNLILLAIAAFNAVPMLLSAQAAGTPVSPEDVFPSIAVTADQAPDAPDVWHLVFDRYGDAETLSRVYGHDNSPFLAALAERSFTIADANANYQRTAHSLASTLNMDYLDALARRAAGNGDSWVPLYDALADNRAARFFTSVGYEMHHFGSWWNPTRRSPHADANHLFRVLPGFGELLLRQSAVGRAMAAAGLPYGDTRRDQCLRAHRQFQGLRDLSASAERKYVFAHILVPHPPYVLDEQGACKSLGEAEADGRRENYVDQVVYANGEILSVVDAILAGTRPAVVVLSSDEGPWPEPYVGDERFIGRDPVAVEWGKLPADKLREKMGILYAVRTPDGKAMDLGKTPVNLYRHLLTRYFGAELEALPDRSFVFLNDRNLYRFEDVSDLLD